jgi:putative intracellular protease/amidase
MIKEAAVQNPLSWASPTFSLAPYDLVFIPGGHDKAVRQLIDSAALHKHLADYFPQTRKPSRKTVAAICHGPQVLAATSLPDGKSVLHDATTTALPGMMEGFIFWATRLFLGDYYKTYGAGTDNVETIVRFSPL